MSNYIASKQPCDNYTPDQDFNENATWDNEHECPPCAKANSAFAKRSFCTNCYRDHHDGGWDKHSRDITEPPKLRSKDGSLS